MDSTLDNLLATAKTRFIESNPKSASQHEKAAKSLPGGNTRTTLHTDPFPIYITRGEGTTLITADDVVLTDFVGELTAGLYGHSNPIIRSAIIETFDKQGMALGATIEAETLHAELICQRFDLDQVRFTNSGTEASLNAILAAKAFTGRKKVVMFNKGYHGSLIWALSDGTLPINTVNSDDTFVLKYNDIEGAKQFFQDQGKSIAAIIVEPMQGSGGAIPGDSDFLLCLQTCAKDSGAIFILDEVMTSRLAPGGLKSTIPGLQPDLTLLGKYLGGGFPFGAFGGRIDVMKIFDPRQPNHLNHLGTFNNDTMTMNIGFIALKNLYPSDVCLQFNARADDFRSKLNEVTEGTKLGFTGIGSIMHMHVTNEGVRERELKNAADVKEILEFNDLFWYEMLEERFWVHKRGMIVLSLGIPDEELDRFVKAVKDFVKRHENLLKL